jgi:hypothetical protein
MPEDLVVYMSSDDRARAMPHQRLTRHATLNGNMTAQKEQVNQAAGTLQAC